MCIHFLEVYEGPLFVIGNSSAEGHPSQAARYCYLGSGWYTGLLFGLFDVGVSASWDGSILTPGGEFLAILQIHTHIILFVEMVLLCASNIIFTT